MRVGRKPDGVIVVSEWELLVMFVTTNRKDLENSISESHKNI